MRLNKLRLATVLCSCLALGVGLVTACSSDDSSTSPPTPDSGTADVVIAPTTDGSPGNNDGGAEAGVSVACGALATARCGKLDTCANAIGTETRYGDDATCVSRLTAQCVASLAAASTGATAASTQTCADAVGAQACATYFGVLDAPEACAPQPGALANGAACSVSAQCQSAFCNVGPHAACGVCAAPSTLGSSCGPMVGCSRGFVCTGGGTASGTCVAPSGVGQVCGTGAPCDTLLHCLVADAGADAGDAGDAAAPTTGSCEADIVTPGGSCTNKEIVCGRGSGVACTGTGASKTCTVLGVAATGAACGTIDGGAVACSASGDCEIDAGQKVGSCQAAIADTMPCALDIANPCLPPAKCVDNGSGSGTCTLLDPTQCH